MYEVLVKHKFNGYFFDSKCMKNLRKILNYKWTFLFVVLSKEGN